MSALVESYKEVMSHWPSGVTIVTTQYQGVQYGMTVSSFTSVSLHPAMISVCIDKRSQMCVVLQNSRQMAVSILSTEQTDLGLIFANHELNMSERFSKADFCNKTTHSPVLKSCVGWVDCSIHSAHDVGDHVILIGAVLSAYTSGTEQPVLYYRRSFRTDIQRPR